MSGFGLTDMFCFWMVWIGGGVDHASSSKSSPAIKQDSSRVSCGMNLLMGYWASDFMKELLKKD